MSEDRTKVNRIAKARRRQTWALLLVGVALALSRQATASILMPTAPQPADPSPILADEPAPSSINAATLPTAPANAFHESELPVFYFEPRLVDQKNGDLLPNSDASAPSLKGLNLSLDLPRFDKLPSQPRPFLALLAWTGRL